MNPIWPYALTFLGFHVSKMRPLTVQLAPLGVVFGRVSPAGIDFAVRSAGPPGVLIRLRARRQSLGHEPDLAVRLDLPRVSRFQDATVDGPARPTWRSLWPGKPSRYRFRRTVGRAAR